MGRALGWLIGLIGLFAVLVWGAWAAFIGFEKTSLFNLVGGVGLLMMSLWVFLDWGSLSSLGKDQTAQRSFTAGLSVMLVLAISATLNVMGYRFDDRLDLTANKRFTLSQQSLDIVSKLDREITVLAFFTNGSPEKSNFQELVKGYEARSTLLKVQWLDPYADPIPAQENQITSAAGTVILKVGEKKQRLESDFSEEALTNALLKLTSDTQYTVCVVQGHGEPDLASADTPVGLGLLNTALENQNYKVQAVSLTEAIPSPDTCKALLEIAPQTDLLAGERDRLAQYLVGGGNLIVALDPLLTPETAADMARYGVTLGNDLVIEGDPQRQLQGGDPTFILLDPSSFDISPITEKLKGLVVLRMARSVSKGTPPDGVNVQELAFSSEGEMSWAETDIAGLQEGRLEPNPGADRVGKVPLMVSAEITQPGAIRTETAAVAPAAPDGSAAVPALPALSTGAKATPPTPKAGGKLLVIGDGDFTQNVLLQNGLNKDLILNAIGWMIGDERQLSIRPNEAAKGKLTIDTLSLFFAAITSLLLVPGLAVTGGVGTWLARRR